MYDWRRMSQAQRDEVLHERRLRHAPWHRPETWDVDGEQTYLITSACFEHEPIIGKDPARLAECEIGVLEACQTGAGLHAWCILPNHYHLLVTTSDLKIVRGSLGRLHGRTSHAWNGEDNTRGRQVWHACADRWIRTDRHFWTSMNYVHHNPVRHGYVRLWNDWPFSSAIEFLQQVGRERAAEIWREYPLREYGRGWDLGS